MASLRNLVNDVSHKMGTPSPTIPKPVRKQPVATPARNVAARKRPAGGVGEIARLGPEIGKQVRERKAKLGILKGQPKMQAKKKKIVPVGLSSMNSNWPY